MNFILKILTKNSRLTAVLVLGLAALLFVAPAVIKQGYFVPADIIRSLWLFADGTKPHNTLLSDVLYCFLPWFQVTKELLTNGQFPLWNPYSGGGLPLFANMQSAVLFPLSGLVYLLDFKLSLILISFLKLFFIGLFTYLYLRAIKLGNFPSTAGAIVFMFAGLNIVWLAFPTGNPVFLLPLGLYLLEKYFRQPQARYALYLGLALAIGVLAGHPETFFHILFVLIVYTLFKLTSRQLKWRQKFIRVAALTGSGILGAGLAAILLLPFFEYLQFSQVALKRSDVNTQFLPKSLIILNIVPDLLGNPAFGRYLINYTNYSESTMGYVGVSFVLLALGGIIWFYKERLVRFYALLAIFGLAVIYGLPGLFGPGLFELTAVLPGFKQARNHRLLLITAFSIMVLGAYGLDALYKKRVPVKKIIMPAILLTGLTSVLFILNLRSLPNGWLEMILQWQTAFFVLFIANLILLLIILMRGLEKERKFWFAPAFLLLAFLETGGHGAFYNTVTKPADFFPSHPAISYLQKEFQTTYDKTFFPNTLLPPNFGGTPNLGTWYKINEVLDYDAMGLPGWEKFKGVLNPFVYANNPAPDADAVLAGLPNLRFIGGKFLVFPRDLGKEILKKSSERLGPVYEDERAIILSQPVLPRAYLLQTASVSEARGILSQLKENINARPWQPVRSLALQQNGNSTIEYDSPSPAYLVLNENYYPGWQATIDNGPAVKIEDGLGLKLIKVPAGKHTVKVVYWPKSFRLGLTISAASLGVWLALFLLLRRKQLPAPVGHN